MSARILSQLIRMVSLALLASVLGVAVHWEAVAWGDAPTDEEQQGAVDPPGGEEGDEDVEPEQIDDVWLSTTLQFAQLRTFCAMRATSARLLTSWREPDGSIARPPDA